MMIILFWCLSLLDVSYVPSLHVEFKYQVAVLNFPQVQSNPCGECCTAM